MSGRIASCLVRFTCNSIHSVSSDAVYKYLQSGNTFNANISGNANTANAFKTQYSSTISPAQASGMVAGSRTWTLAYSKNYMQTVSVSWEDYSSHTFPTGAGGIFIPSYSSNGGTLILVNYPVNRMLYNVWIDSNRWSGWHYVDLTAITYT